jgi:hypothetical protein
MKINKRLLKNALLTLILLAFLKKIFNSFKIVNKSSSQKLKFKNMDSILFWNQVALEANRISHTNGWTNKPDQH